LPDSGLCSLVFWVKLKYTTQTFATLLCCLCDLAHPHPGIEVLGIDAQDLCQQAFGVCIIAGLNSVSHLTQQFLCVHAMVVASIWR
jgi:hypothetical protein